MSRWGLTATQGRYWYPPCEIHFYRYGLHRSATPRVARNPGAAGSSSAAHAKVTGARSARLPRASRFIRLPTHGDWSQVDTTLRHEIAHIVHRSVWPCRWPLWADEGLAMLAAPGRLAGRQQRA